MNKKKRWITTAAILAVFCAALGYYNFRHDSPDAEAGPEALPAPQHVLDKHFMRKHGPNAYYGQK